MHSFCTLLRPFLNIPSASINLASFSFIMKITTITSAIIVDRVRFVHVVPNPGSPYKCRIVALNTNHFI